MPYLFLGALVGGFLLDLLIGDPHGFPHFVCGIGSLISRLQTILRRIFPKTKLGERLAGTCMAVLVLLISGGVPLGLLLLLGKSLPGWLCFRSCFSAGRFPRQSA